MAVVCGQVETGSADMWGIKTAVYGGERLRAASVKSTSVGGGGGGCGVYLALRGCLAQQQERNTE